MDSLELAVSHQRWQREEYLVLAMTGWLPVECSGQGTAPPLSSSCYCKGVVLLIPPKAIATLISHTQCAVLGLWVTD